MTQPVTITRDGKVAVVMLDNPPVNAMSFHLREPLHAALRSVRDDDGVAAVVIACAGRTFVAGADITEFNTPKSTASPNLRELIVTLEAFTKPTVAAIHGTAFGGGLELAMGLPLPRRRRPRPVRPAGSQARPAAGRRRHRAAAARLIGPEKALTAIVSGNPIGAKAALADGLVDAVCEDDLVEHAVAFAREALAAGKPLVTVRDREDKLAAARADLAGFDARIAEVLKKSKGLDAPKRCADAVRNSLTMPFDEALTTERKYFVELVEGNQSKAQRHLFFAEREAAKVAGVGKDDKPRKIAKVGVIGAGTMGGGISMSFVNGGIPVTILEMTDEALKRGLGVIEKNYGISVSRGSLTEEAKAKRMAMFTGTTDYADLADCDLIVEAVFEEMGVKKQVFETLDRIAKPGAILASNTSYLDVNEIAASPGGRRTCSACTSSRRPT